VKGLIDRKGQLKIERAGILKYQFCPYRNLSEVDDSTEAVCDDSCPLFGEPVLMTFTTQTGTPLKITHSIEAEKVTSFEICNGRMLKFTEFTDERSN